MIIMLILSNLSFRWTKTMQTLNDIKKFWFSKFWNNHSQPWFVTLQESAAEETTVKRRGRPPGSRNKGRASGTNTGASQQTQRRASRQRSNPKSNAAQEAAVDDPLFIDSEACDAEGSGTNTTQNENDGENYEEDDEDGRYTLVWIYDDLFSNSQMNLRLILICLFYQLGEQVFDLI